MISGIDIDDVRLTATRAIASSAVHLTEAPAEGRVPAQTLCGRAVAHTYGGVTLGAAGCSDCALHAIAMGVEVVRTEQQGFMRIHDLQCD